MYLIGGRRPEIPSGSEAVSIRATCQLLHSIWLPSPALSFDALAEQSKRHGVTLKGKTDVVRVYGFDA
ncbi:MAG: hypothetical protein J2O48_09370 [Solirubrobacterales bacterium]|nr:hypothetical protein [Solirubrobacterales bacterium]